MANLKETSRRWPSHTAEKFVPTSFWTEDDKPNDVLNIHLPGFKHDEVRIELASEGHIKIEGERIVNESKCIYIDQTFPLPENPDVDNIVGKFEGEYLYITVPKLVFEETKDEDSKINENGNSSSTAEEDEESNNNNKTPSKDDQADRGATQRHDKNKKGKINETCRIASFPKETIDKWECKDNPLEMTIKCLKKNKGIALSIFLSFSIGVWVSNIKYGS